MVWVDTEYAKTLTPQPTGDADMGYGGGNGGYVPPAQTYGPTQPTRQYAPSADTTGRYYRDDPNGEWLWEDFAPADPVGGIYQPPQSVFNPPYPSGGIWDYAQNNQPAPSDLIDNRPYPAMDFTGVGFAPYGDASYYEDGSYNYPYTGAPSNWIDYGQVQPGDADQGLGGFPYTDPRYGDADMGVGGSVANMPGYGMGDPEVAQWQGNPTFQQPSPFDVPLGTPQDQALREILGVERRGGGFFEETGLGKGFDLAAFPSDYISELGIDIFNPGGMQGVASGGRRSAGPLAQDLEDPRQTVEDYRDRPLWQQLAVGAVVDPLNYAGGLGFAADAVDFGNLARRGGGALVDATRGLGDIDTTALRRALGGEQGSIDFSHPHVDNYTDTLAKYEIEYGFDDTGRIFLNDPEGAQLTADGLLSRAAQDIIAVHTDASRAVGSFDGLGNRVVNGRTIEGGGGARATHTFGTGSPEAYAAMRDAERIFDVLDEVPTSPALEAARTPWPDEAVFPAVSDDEFRALERQWNQTIAAKKTTSVEGRAIAAELGIAEADRYIANVVSPEYGIRDTLHSISAEIDRVERYERNTVPLRKGERLQDGVRLSGGKLVDREYTLPIPKRAYVTRLREVLAEIDDKGLEGLHNVARAADTRPGQSIPSAVAPDEVRAAVAPAAGRSAATPGREVTVKQPDLFGNVRDTYKTEGEFQGFRESQGDLFGRGEAEAKLRAQSAPESIAVSNAPRPTPTFPLRGDRVTDAAGREGTVIRGSNTGAKAPITVRFEDGTTKRAARDAFTRVQPDVETMTLRELARELDLDPKMRQQLIVIEAKAAKGSPEDQMLAEAAKRRLGDALAEERKTAPALSGPRAKPQATSKPPVEGPPLSVIDRPDAPPLTFADEAIIGGKPPPPGKFDSSVPPSSPHWKPTKGGLVTLLGEIINLPRALLSSMDISAGGRQGIIYAFSRPKQWSAAWKPAFQSMMSNKRAILLDHALDARPNARIQREAGLYRAPVDNKGVKLADREEHFMSSWVGKIPLVGATQRHYVTFLNTLRATVFDAKWNSLDPLQQTAENAKELARVINSATGRGPRLTTDGIAPVVNGALFSERNLTAKFSLINQAVGAGTTGMGPARQEALRALLGFTAGNIALLGTLKAAGLIDVELDPRSADFGKMRIGPARYDLGGGYLQLIRYGAQILSGERKDSYGEIQSADRWDTFGKFGRSKLSPTAGEAVNQIGGKDFMGEDIDNSPLGIARRLLVPLSPEDIDQARREFGIEAALWMLPTLVGIGTQYYESAPEARDRFAKDWAETNGITTTDGRTITKFDDLNAGQQREVRARMKDGQEPREPNLGNEYEQSAHSKRLKEEAYARLEGELKNYITAAAAKPVLKEQIQDFKKQRYTASQTAYSESQKAGFPDSDKPEDLLAEMYWSAPVGTDYKTGRLDFSEQERIRADVLAKAREQGIDPNYITGDGPLTFRGQRFADPDVRQAVKEYEDAQKLVSGSGIWDIKDKTWGDLKAMAPADLGAYQTFDDFREAYIQLLIPEYTKAGMSAAVARTQAENKVGGFPVTKRYYDLVNALETEWMLKNPDAATAAVEWGWWEPTKKQAGASIGVIR